MHLLCILNSHTCVYMYIVYNMPTLCTGKCTCIHANTQMHDIDIYNMHNIHVHVHVHDIQHAQCTTYMYMMNIQDNKATQYNTTQHNTTTPETTLFQRKWAPSGETLCSLYVHVQCVQCTCTSCTVYMYMYIMYNVHVHVHDIVDVESCTEYMYMYTCIYIVHA